MHPQGARIASAAQLAAASRDQAAKLKLSRDFILGILPHRLRLGRASSRGLLFSPDPLTARS